MRGLFALASLIAVALIAASVAAGTDTAAYRLQPAIIDFAVVDYLAMESDADPKFPSPRPVHVLADRTARIFARTRGLERLDVLVQLSGTESFGVFSGTPDRNGFVSIDVAIPAGGSWHDFRIPGPEGKREPGQIKPRTLFMLAPTGYVTGSLGIRGEAVWVRLEE